jgi:hypothetical protein
MIQEHHSRHLVACSVLRGSSQSVPGGTTSRRRIFPLIPIGEDNGHIRLHKIVSNNVDVMKAFSTDELGKDLKTLDLYSDILPTQQSLGLEKECSQTHEMSYDIQ